MKRDQVILEREDGATEPTLEPPDLRAALDDALARDAYLTASEAALYVRSATTKAFYDWRARHGVRACRSGTRGRLLFKRQDLDEALQPVEERHRRHYFTSHRGGRS